MFFGEEIVFSLNVYRFNEKPRNSENIGKYAKISENFRAQFFREISEIFKEIFSPITILGSIKKKCLSMLYRSSNFRKNLTLFPVKSKCLKFLLICSPCIQDHEVLLSALPNLLWDKYNSWRFGINPTSLGRLEIWFSDKSSILKLWSLRIWRSNDFLSSLARHRLWVVLGNPASTG